VEIKNVGDLWETKSPFKYLYERQEEYTKLDPDFLERPNEFLKDAHRQRWTEMHYFWF